MVVILANVGSKNIEEELGMLEHTDSIGCFELPTAAPASNAEWQ
jgi:hypothetical protein